MPSLSVPTSVRPAGESVLSPAKDAPHAHTLIRARGTDNVGNTGFTMVEMTLDNAPPPVPQITRQPPSPSGGTAVFEFTVAESGAAAQCRLDAGVWSTCSSPLTYDGLANGEHTFEVRAVDAAGNTGAAASYSWTVDLGLPTLGIVFPAGEGRYNETGFDAGCGVPGRGRVRRD